jgi:tetratricopeptide (TPR) repeat protein
MATPTAPVAVSTSMPIHSHQPVLPPPRPQPRVLWPWPAFLLGIAAVVAVFYLRPIIRPTDADRLQRDLAELHRLLEQGPIDLDRSITLAKRVLENNERFPQYVGEAHYLLGSAYLARAEDSTTSDPTEAWQEACREFEQAEQAGVPDNDRPRLNHKYGKVLFLTKAEPKLTLGYLEQGEDNDNPTERWRLMADVYLIQAEPNRRAAIEALRNALTLAPPTADPTQITKDRLRLSELYLLENELAEARKALERIDVNAPTEIYLKSRFLLARCYAAEGKYQQASATWDQVKNNPRLTAAERGAACYHLGVCLAKLDRNGDAVDSWRQAQLAGGEAQQAAALRQAEMQLADANERTQAIASLEKALETVSKPEEYRNELLRLADAQAALAQMCQSLRSANSFSDASRLADLYAKLAPPGKGHELPAEVAEAWGQALLTESKTAAGASAQHSREEARKQFRKAGTAFTEAASPERPVSEQRECLRRATSLFFKAQDKLDIENGLALLERMTKLGPGDESDSEVVFLKALAHQQLGHKAEAIESYRKISQQADHPNAPRARFELARLTLESLPTKAEEQEPILDQVIADLEKNLDPALREKDREIHELSMYLLGDATYQRRNWTRAQTCLEDALRLYPQDPHALMARFMYGRCLWFQAGRESQQLSELRLRMDQLAKALTQQLQEKEREAAAQELAKVKKDWEASKTRYRDLLEKAKRPFEEVESTLQKREQDSRLSDEDRPLMRQAAFAAAETYFFREEYDEALRCYQILKIRYEGQFEELVALSQLFQCAIYIRDTDKAKIWVDSVREALKKLPDSAFDGSSNFHKREFWEAWPKQAEAFLESVKKQTGTQK